MNNYSALLQQYRSLWNNRLLKEDDTDENVLKKTIEKELRDENSHPRVRKSVYEKYYLAIKRITDSSIPDCDKLLLIQLHTELLDEIKNYNN